jgi:hypothetical protein
VVFLANKFLKNAGLSANFGVRATPNLVRGDHRFPHVTEIWQHFVEFSIVLRRGVQEPCFLVKNDPIPEWVEHKKHDVLIV